MTLKEGQLVTYAIDEIIETVQNLTPMASKVTKYTPPAESMQRSSNTVWMPVEQEAPTQTGWDLTGNATGILELSVKCNMGDPDNDFFELRADDLRDERSYRRRIQASAKKLANNIESAIAKQATEMGSLVVHDTRAIGPSTGLSGWDFVSDAERLMFSRELNRDMGISYFLNPDDYRKAGRNLVDGDIFGRVPEDAYRNGTIQRQIQEHETRIAQNESDIASLDTRVQSLESQVSDHESRIDALEYATTRKKSEVVYSGVSVTIPTAPTNLVSLLKTLTPSSGTLAPFFDTVNNKMVVFNENKTLFFKLSIVGTWPSGTANRSMQLTFSGSVPDTLVSSRNAATTTDNILLATFFSVDKDGFLATNGSTLTIQSNGAAFTATTIKIIAEQ